MKKIIKIDRKDYTMQASAYTQFAYKNETGRSLLKDLQDISELQNQSGGNIDFDVIDKITEPVLKIAYVMIQEADSKQVDNYESFLKSIDNLYDDFNWVLEVIQLACSPLSRQLQDDKQ